MSEVLNDYNIFLINLKRRPDRLEHARTQLKQFDLDYEVWGAWDASTIDEKVTDQEIEIMCSKPFYSWSKKENLITGRKGCMLSHLKLLEYAFRKRLRQLLVFEDDLVLTSSYIPPPPGDAVMCFLGGKIEGKLPEGTEEWIRIKNFKVWELHSYMVIGHHNIWRCFRAMTDPNLCPRAIDAMVVKRIQPKLPCYVLRNQICKQNREIKSDVTFIDEMQ